MVSVATQIQNETNATKAMQAKTDTVTGAASANLSSTDFLNLLMKQLQYQDPMAPTDNAQFVSQQCQFAQLSATQEMSSNIASNNSISQTLSMVGKNVTVIDPTDKTGKTTVSGVVEEAKFNSTGSVITVKGKDYPISLVTSVKSASTADTGTTTTTGTTGTTTTTGTTSTST